MVSTTASTTESITVIMATMNKNENPIRNNDGNMKNNGAGKKGIFKILTIVCIIAFLACIIWLANYFVQLGKADKDLEALKESYVVETTPAPVVTVAPQPIATATPDAGTASDASASAEPTASPEPESLYPGLEGYEVPDKDIDFAALQSEQNEHIYAWINVPGTVIDYPVLQHPEELSYYLDHNLDHSKGYPGCVFSELFNSKEWDDPMTVLYGHNMKNGTMFAGLHQFRDPQFFEENQYIYIYTEELVKVYQIFAAYEYSDMDLVQMYQIGGKKMYQQYLDSIYSLDGMSNNFNTDIEVTIEDRVLTLATCISTKPTQRYLVQGVQVAEGPYEK